MKNLMTIGFILCCIAPGFAQVMGGKHPSEVKQALEEKENTIAYRKLGAMMLNFSNYISHLNGVVSMPINLNPEITVCNNFTAGPLVTYLQRKNVQDISETALVINDGNINYHHLMVGVKGSYHLLPLIQKMIRKPMLVDYVDVYVSGWSGYSMVFSNKSDASIAHRRDTQTIRGGASIGVRSMVLPKFGFFAEGGYGSYGYMSFGLTARLR
jgi:hypothetical protein